MEFIEKNTSKKETNYKIEKLFEEPKSDYIKLKDLVKLIWGDRKSIFVFVVFGCMLSIIYTYMKPVYYQSQATLLTTNSNQDSISNLLNSSFGGVASLAGLGNFQNNSNSIEVIETLKSREFISNFANKREIVNEIAAKKWNPVKQKYEINTKVFDPETNKWLIGKNEKDWIVYKKFKEILSISENKKNGVIKVSIKWHDSESAAKWVNWIVDDLNSLIRQKKRGEAEQAINYLRGQVSSTTLINMHNSLYNLIETQLKVKMLADIRENYALTVIDPAIPSIESVGPKKIFILFLALIIFSVIALGLSIFRFSALPKINKMFDLK